MRQSTGQASQRMTSLPSGAVLSGASSGSRTGLASLVFADCRAQPVRQHGNPAHAHASRLLDRAENRGRRRDEARLADSLGAERAERFLVLDQDTTHAGGVADGRNEIVVQVFGAPGNVLFHEREPEALKRAALDLTFNQHGVDGTPDIVRGMQLDNTRRAELEG